MSYPVYVDVESPDETSVSFTDLDPVAGDESPVAVTVSNSDTSPISNVKLDVGGDAVVEESGRVYPSIAAGSETTETYNVTFPTAGEQTLSATVQYRTSDGATRTATFGETTDVEVANIDTDLTATVTEANEATVIQAELSEYGNVDLNDIQLRAIVDGDVVKRTSVPDVPVSSTRTFTVGSSGIPAGEVTLVAEYTAANERYTSNTTFDFNPRQQANIELTGIEAERTGSTITVSGEAANLGSLDASSVIVNVATTDAIAPSSPNGEYFIGSVESSEFATFELTANADQASDNIPIEIRYSTDGEQFVQTARVDISTEGISEDDRAAASSGSEGSNNSGIPLTGLGIVLLLGVLGGGGLYWWRRQS
ncbi:CARDB domain-containing protein [Halosegnis longus]|uniref:CARDB domain-containing protein n=1 Tax=Halosegnis longus TaxID=2216012 RepID=UPI0018F7456B